MITAFKYEYLFGLFNGDEKMDDCEFCGTAYAEEHYLDTEHRFTKAHKTFGSIYVCDTCIGDGLKLLQEQRR